MTPSDVVNKVWQYCHVLRDDGVSYGDYVEQLTYLLFLKMDDEVRSLAGAKPVANIPSNYNWQALSRKDGAELETHYRETLETLSRQDGIVGLIFRKSQNKIQDPAKLKRLIDDIGKETWMGLDIDVKGEIYEGLLQKNAEDTKSGAGQYFTPRAIIQAMVEVIQPQPGETIADPACGTGGFFLGAYQYLTDPKRFSLDKKQKLALREKTFKGWELVANTARLCAMNLFLHGVNVENRLVSGADSLVADPGDRFDIILTNPPFGKKSSVTVLAEDGGSSREAQTYQRDDFWVSSSNKQLNFVQHVHTLLEVGGRAAVVVPDNVLFEGGAGETVRRNLLKSCDVHTLLRLPTGVFYAQGVKANVIFFEKKAGAEKPWTDKLWIYDLRTNQHFTLKENPIQLENLKDFITSYNPTNRHKRKETERFKCFTYDQLVARDKVSLDIFWLKDDSLADAENLPAPEVIAAEIVEDLEAALESFRAITEELKDTSKQK